VNYDENQLTGKKILSLSFYLYRFRKYVSYGFPIINFCDPGVHYETPCIFRILQILEKKWECKEAVHQLFIDFKKAYDSVRREVLYNILIEFGIPMKLVRLIKMSLTETYRRVRVDKNLFDVFPIKNGLKQGDALSPLLFNFALEDPIRRVQVTRMA